MKFLGSLIIFIAILSASLSPLLADMPGNKPRPDMKFVLNGVKKVKSPWSLRVTVNGEKEVLLSKDTVITLKGGFGAPQWVSVWAISKNTLTRTEAITHNVGDGKEIRVSIAGVKNNMLMHKKNIIKEEGAPFFSDGDDSPQAPNAPILVGTALAALLALVSLFLLRKRVVQV